VYLVIFWSEQILYNVIYLCNSPFDHSVTEWVIVEITNGARRPHVVRMYADKNSKTNCT